MSTHSITLIQDFWQLTKPRVVALVMLTAVIGAGLAAFQHRADWPAVVLTLLGIAFVAAAAAAFNCMVEIYADSIMQRTRLRPLPAGRLRHEQAALFVVLLGSVGLLMTTLFGGTLMGILTGATFFGYAVVYTLFLKRATPQNIVIGGASGAMPPLLGWLAVAGQLSYEPFLLFLIIFVWTPPHFWALALYRKDDYANAGIPMLPVTHGARFTAVQILLYGVMLLVVAVLPYISGMAGLPYLAAALLLNGRFLQLAWRLWRSLSPRVGHQLFSYSITYLAALFSALLLDALVR